MDRPHGFGDVCEEVSVRLSGNQDHDGLVMADDAV
jgi:hypothetical protein